MNYEKELLPDSEEVEAEEAETSPSEEQSDNDFTNNDIEKLKAELQAERGKRTYYENQYKKIKPEVKKEKEEKEVKTSKSEFEVADIARASAKYNNEVFEHLTEVAKFKKVSLAEAEKDGIFTMFLDNYKKLQTKKQAELASSSAGKATEDTRSGVDFHRDFLKERGLKK